ncbi:hypothetical protein [Inquilinus sp. Marseille-Q2685]|uniref:hypothetical protein n=1 Tax=Inquilinus sp. Marseille-Q2685 TaxID=2866581 RepID=UPI001CE456ED|nr:hypothetical protein [Inquilinus sp. Marseille-Q2685]
MPDAREKLVDFVTRRAFDPVLKAQAEGRSEAEKRKLEHAQEATRTEIERYRGYGSAKEVVVNFKRDLDSEPARKVHAELKALGLPTVNDIRDEFESMAKELGVDASR